MAGPFSRVDVDGWDAYVAACSGLNNWIFRGQAHDWELSTSIQRYAAPHVAPAAAEIRAYREFQRRAHQYLPAQSLPGVRGPTR